MAKHNFREIIAWQKAKQIAPLVYKLTKEFPLEEKYALASQVKRAAVSISSNIAEGSGRKTSKDFSHFLDMALGSAFELESEMLVAIELKFVTDVQCEVLFSNLDEIEKLIVGFQNHLNRNL